MPISGSKQGSSTTLDHILKLRKRLFKRYGITNADCEHHARVCIRAKEDSRYTKVASQFDQLWKALDLAHSVYMDDPSMFNANAYTSLTRELRGCLMDLNKVQSSDEVADEIVATALNPMVKRMTTAIITEASRLKEDLLARFSEEDADKVVNSYVERLAVQIQDVVPYARDRIADALSARDKNRKKALQGKATMKRGSAQGLPHSDSETKGKLLSLPSVG
jgi:hypothetical protein